jgi:DNA-binding LacI/PurR family transcriptional regulator
MDQVAEAAGVSRATVSRVINGAPSVDAKIRDIVQRAIADTGYVPNVAARSLVTRKSNSVALVISEPDRPHDSSFLNRIFTDPYFGRVTAGATGALRPHDIHLVIIPTDSSDHHHVLRYLRQGHVDGVLLISSHEQDPLPRQVHELGIPAVVSARPAAPLAASFVDVDHRLGACSAAAAGGWPRSAGRWTSRPARTGWTASARSWPPGAWPTCRRSRATSPGTAARRARGGCSPSTPTSTPSSWPAT